MANVLSIVPYTIFPAKFGGQKGIANFNEYFSRHHHLTVVTVKENLPGAEPYPIINTLGSSRWRYVNIYLIFPLLRIIREKRISHLIVEHPYFGWLGLLLRSFTNVKLIIHSHNIEAERFKTTGKWWWRWLWHYEKQIHRMANFTFCISANDRQYFTDVYKIAVEKTAVITFGISLQSPPPATERSAAKEVLLEKYGLPADTTLYMFNGALNYLPNYDAVTNILEKINPLFIKKNLPYQIIICGKGLPAEMDELRKYRQMNVIYAGYVDDITLYFKGVDIFINPVTDGGGIKTKLVEALGYGMNAVSTFNGAIGVDPSVCGEKLWVCENDDWQDFALKMQEAIGGHLSTGAAFFGAFYWDNIAQKAAEIVERL